MKLREYFKPDYFLNDLEEIKVDKLYLEGIRHVFLDIDGTLSPQGATHPCDHARQICKRLKEAGIDIFIASNAKTERAETYAKELQVSYPGHAVKPFSKLFRHVCKEKSLDTGRCLMVGDQLLTDLWAGRNAGMRVLLVSPMPGKEPFQIRIKRLFERFIRSYVVDYCAAPPL